MLSILAAPFAACLVIAALHCYVGLHVIRRGVIFVDLALAQVAALGGVVALLIGPLVLTPRADHEQADGSSAEVYEMGYGDEEELVGEDVFAYALSLTFATLGAALFAIGRFRDGRVPHEAIIGIVYVVSAALAMLVLNKTPHGSEEMQAMLLGSILFVDWGTVGKTALLYLALAILHAIWGKKFMRISESVEAASAEGMNLRLWDFLFYAIFGLMVTQSVRIGGVLVVFSFLIIPAVCATMLISTFRRRLIFAWVIALLASVGGLYFSAAVDMPTGASLVAAFGTMLVLCACVNPFIRRGTTAR